jgi:hypothetical protein
MPKRGIDEGFRYNFVTLDRKIHNCDEREASGKIFLMIYNKYESHSPLGYKTLRSLLISRILKIMVYITIQICI